MSWVNKEWNFKEKLLSDQQYNLQTKTDYLKRKMFLDPAGPVTIQRFEEFRYPKISNFEQTQRGFFWIPEP